MSHYKDHKPAVILLCITILFSFAFAYREGRRLYQIQLFKIARSAVEQKIAANHGPLGSSNVSVISPWMTFSYVNIIFKLPPLYLESALNISDSQYPNLIIARYAKLQKIQSDVFVGQIQSAVTAYFQNH